MDVTVTNPDSQTSTLANGFTYQVATVTPPGISSITQSAGNIVIVSTNAANSSLSLYTTTNVADPSTSWTALNTNSVGADGIWTNTVAITGEPQRYFMLAIP